MRLTRRSLGTLIALSAPLFAVTAVPSDAAQADEVLCSQYNVELFDGGHASTTFEPLEDGLDSTPEAPSSATPRIDSSALTMGTLTEDDGGSWTYRLTDPPPPLSSPPADAVDYTLDTARIDWTDSAGNVVACTHAGFTYFHPWPFLQATDDEFWTYRRFVNGDPKEFDLKLASNDTFRRSGVDSPGFLPYVWSHQWVGSDLTDDYLWSTAYFPELGPETTPMGWRNDLGMLWGSHNQWRDGVWSPDVSPRTRTLRFQPYVKRGDITMPYQICPPYPVRRECSAAALTIHVRPLVDPRPDYVAAASSGTPVTVDLLANDTVTDIPAQPATIEVSGLPADVRAVVNEDRTVTLTAPGSYDGRGVPFEYVVSDYTGSKTGLAWLQVGTPAPPKARNDTLRIRRGANRSIDVLANDSFAARASVQVGEADGVVAVVGEDGRTVTVSVRPQFRGDRVRVRYTLTDGTQLKDRATLLVIVR